MSYKLLETQIHKNGHHFIKKSGLELFDYCTKQVHMLYQPLSLSLYYSTNPACISARDSGSKYCICHLFFSKSTPAHFVSSVVFSIFIQKQTSNPIIPADHSFFPSILAQSQCKTQPTLVSRLNTHRFFPPSLLQYACVQNLFLGSTVKKQMIIFFLWVPLSHVHGQTIKAVFCKLS